MLKITTALLGLALFSATATAQSYRFADMKWGIPIAEAKQILMSEGFKVSVDEDGDLKFDGTLLDTKAGGFALFAGGKLSKVIVILVTRDQDARKTYSDMKEVLTKKYGPPTNDYAFFTKPYYEGDGYEEQAIRLGKGKFACYWLNAPKGSTSEGDSLGLKITERLTVEIDYESPWWGSEADRRKAKGTRVF
jgi:hypothetical protein